MKKILLPTDFSTTAYNALEYATRLGWKFNASVTLFHCFEMPVLVKATKMKTVKNEHAAHQVQRNFQKRLEKMAGQFGMDNPFIGINMVKFDESAMEGSPYYYIPAKADGEQYELIVLGTRGINDSKARRLGNTSREVIISSEVPVILVAEDVRYRPVNKVLFITDDKVTSLFQLKGFSNQFDAQITVLRVYRGDKEIKDEHIRNHRMFTNMVANFEGLQFDYWPKPLTIEDLDQYITEHNIDVVAAKSKSLDLIDFLATSPVRAMKFQEEIPMFVFHE